MRSKKIKARRGIKAKAAKSKNRSHFLKPVFTHDAIREQWNPYKSQRQNLADMGLADQANSVVQAGTHA